jgi:hypothetical protein
MKAHEAVLQREERHRRKGWVAAAPSDAIRMLPGKNPNTFECVVDFNLS